MRVAVLISGRGSNMKALVESCKAPASPANIVCVVSNRPHARGLDLAKQSGIEIHTVEQKNYPDRLAFEAELNAILTSTDIELVCLAGFMSLLTEDFVKRWHNRLINIHPSLLPAFKGLNTHKRVLVSGVRISGCTVHYVRSKMDEGPIIIQAATTVQSNDTEETLSARVLELEHQCYPLALKWIAEGRIQVIDEKVTIENLSEISNQFISPTS